MALPLHAQPLEDEAFNWLKSYIEVDTINPPGNESRAVDFYAKIFEQEGIKFQSVESAPGRGNIWARLEGGDKPALIFLQHTDVVPANAKYWSSDPLTSVIKDGYLWGRGALDMKQTGISHLASFLSLHRAGVALNRDVIFLATADEEAGGHFGVGWLVKNHPEIFNGAGFVINEGGLGTIQKDEHIFQVEVTQKVPVWIRLVSIDKPGHGSMPNASSSVTRIVEAMNRVRENPFPPRIIPAVNSMFVAKGKNIDDEWGLAFANMKSAIKKPEFMKKLQLHSPSLHALTRDTCSLTRMGGSSKINVVPPEAWAEIDCRILPDRPAEKFIADVKKLLEGTGVEVEIIMAFTPAVSSTNNELYKAIETVTANRYPGSRVIPTVSTGFTDSHFTRDLGIASYGFDPILVPVSEFSRVHGNDERINIAVFKRGIGDLLAIIKTVVLD
ncbi:MAG: M20/M25/M40 family metallo-hydrolase [Gammaproteobacteria bacterium]|nr:M20/M25/M40 family metallo-hydrolase [Gammaproteobacteria bacterium]